MKENNIFFILNSKVIINTIEYIFIGNEKSKIEIFRDLSSALPKLFSEPQVVVYEFNTEITKDENWFAIKKLRSVLPDYITLIVFSEEIEEIKEVVASEIKTIKVVEQDSFFLDNLFSVISTVLENQTVYYQM